MKGSAQDAAFKIWSDLSNTCKAVKYIKILINNELDLKVYLI